MHIYKFRILNDSNEDFFRELEIKSTQTFEDFHNMLIENLKFNTNELASFFLCDNRWRKVKEITLVDMGEEANPVPIMKNSRLCDFIDDPHQHLSWVYDFLNMQTFFIELTRISEAQINIVYPRIISGKGELGKANYTPDPTALGFLDEEFGSEFEELLNDSEDHTENLNEQDEDTEGTGGDDIITGNDDEIFYSVSGN